MKISVLLGLLFFTLSLFGQNPRVEELIREVQSATGEELLEKGIELSDALLETGQYERAERAATRVFKEAKKQGNAEYLAMAMNRQARSVLDNKNATTIDKENALDKIGVSLELLEDNEIENPDLKDANLKLLNAAEADEKSLNRAESNEGETAEMPDTSERRVIVINPGDMEIDIPLPPDVPFFFEKKHDKPGDKRRRQLYQDVLALNLSRLEAEIGKLMPHATPDAPGDPALREKATREAQELWATAREKIDKALENQFKVIEGMDVNQAREELLLAQLRERYDSLTHLRKVDSLNLEKKELALRNQQAVANQQRARRTLTGVGAGSSLIFALLVSLLYVRQRKNNKLLSVKNEDIQREQERSQELLLNILPPAVADELKANGVAKAQRYDSVTVLFSDFKNFTSITEQLPPEQLVAELDFCFKAFDEIVSRYGLEKIKTMGDSYMCAGGLPVPGGDHALRVVQAAEEIQVFLSKWKVDKLAANEPFFEARIGIHTGPVIAGVVGAKKFAYDIWGDTVNLASRLESGSEAGKINISGDTYELVKSHYHCVYRGKVEAKNKGEVDMYFVEGKIWE